MSNFPGPGQPGEQPATQVAPGGGTPPAPYGGGGYPPQPQPPAGGYPVAAGPAPGGGYPGGPGGPGGPGFPAPPTGGGGGKKGLVIGIVAAVVVLVLIVGAVLFFVLRGDDDDDDKRRKSRADSSETRSSDEPSASDSFEPSDEPSDVPSDDLTDGGDVFGDPAITAELFTDAYIEGDCSDMQTYSTADWWEREYGTGCTTLPDAPDMSSAEYEFDEPVVSGTYAVLTGSLYIADSGETYTCTWTLDGTAGIWQVDEFSYVAA